MAAKGRLRIIRLGVEHNKRVIFLSLPESWSILDLMKRLHPLTGVPRRLQKLIFRGGVFTMDRPVSLEQAGFFDGCRMILVVKDWTNA